MKTATATDVKNRFGRYLEISLTQPVVIKKTGKPVAVMISIDEYETLTAVEDKFWVEKALKSEKEGFLGHEESIAFLMQQK
jgi:prevent-host-death family protein